MPDPSVDPFKMDGDSTVLRLDKPRLCFRFFLKKIIRLKKEERSFPTCQLRKGQRLWGGAKLEKAKEGSASDWRSYTGSVQNNEPTDNHLLGGGGKGVGVVALVHEFIHYGNYSSVQL